MNTSYGAARRAYETQRRPNTFAATVGLPDEGRLANLEGKFEKALKDLELRGQQIELLRSDMKKKDLEISQKNHRIHKLEAALAAAQKQGNEWFTGSKDGFEKKLELTSSASSTSRPMARKRAKRIPQKEEQPERTKEKQRKERPQQIKEKQQADADDSEMETEQHTNDGEAKAEQQEVIVTSDEEESGEESEEGDTEEAKPEEKETVTEEKQEIALTEEEIREQEEYNARYRYKEYLVNLAEKGVPVKIPKYPMLH